MRLGHTLAGASASLAVASLAGWPLWQQVAAGGIGAAVGPLPDVDQRRWWRTLDHLLPDEWLGHGGPFRHRGITHWWGLPAVAAPAVLLLPAGQWLAWAALGGWCSHLAADWVFGRACPQEGRGPGIPLAPWWSHHGLGGDVDGWGERWLAVPGLVLLLGLQGWVMIHG
jgi:hypothetical protein